MKFSLLCIASCMAFSVHAQKLPYQNSKLEVSVRVKDLLKRMTLDEKIAELNLVPYYAQNDSTLRANIRKGRIGAFLKANGAALNKSLQQIAMRHSRLGIPLIFHEDVIHGYRTLSPIPLAEACSWDTVMVRRSAEAAAKEAAASGIHLTYAPMVDISTDPRWGRIMETSGEDAFLGSAMSSARVRGFQGNDLEKSDTYHVAACVKHFAGYGALLAGRDYQNTDFSLRDLRERYLPPFQAAIDAGVASVMCAYTSYDGEPLTMNHFMNTDVLRKEMGFKGLLMSDWVTLAHAVEEGAAADGREASLRGIESGLDMDMTSQNYSRYLKELIESGDVDVKLLDRSVRNALALKFKMGLFDDPYAYFDVKREKKVLGSKSIQNDVFEMACASMVLLHNQNSLLPLSDHDTQIALIGPWVEAKGNDFFGSWTMKGKDEEVISVVEGFAKRIPASSLIKSGCALDFSDKDIPVLVDKVKNADVVVACLGESSGRIGEAVSTSDLRLPANQIDLLRALKKQGKKVVTVLFNGRPLVLNDVLENSDAILEAWYPGTMGGDAVAALLLGEKNPSGKLVQSFPRSVGQVPISYNMRRTFGKINHQDISAGPLFPFGYGLSYTSFNYEKPEADRTTYTQGDVVQVKVKVTNSGKVKGKEVVQLYVRDEVASIVPREHELKGFHIIELEPGQSKIVVFNLPSSCFEILNNKMQKVLEPGDFTIQVGCDSEHLQNVKISFS